ncbi:MAG: hypothetical protein JWO58_2256 [Chitinophagaceae bacterium]|nr:hypothetical protein [Chitinophagaceae bacterium]
MKATCLFASALFLINTFQSSASVKTDSLGMLGDQLDLYGVLDLFKNSDNLEDFEKKLNSEDNHINNLDLNNDGQIDYIRVIDYPQQNDAHAIVLQDPINDKESQDIAVIELDKTADNQAHIQIVGDEDLYGKDYIVEPVDEQQQQSYQQNNNQQPYVANNNTAVVVNVWGWRPMRYLYGPSYVAWVSPWRWSYYPGWWRPWRPLGWHAYHPWMFRYHAYYHPIPIRRSPRIYAAYGPRRVNSPVVYANRTTINKTYYVRQNNNNVRGGQINNNTNNSTNGRGNRQVNGANGQQASPQMRSSQGNRQQKMNGGGNRNKGGGGNRGRR